MAKSGLVVNRIERALIEGIELMKDRFAREVERLDYKH